MFQRLIRSGLLVAALLLPDVVWAAAPQPSPLAARIAAAAPGAVLTVAGGVHHGDITIDKPLTLIGESGAILDGDGKGNVIRIAASHVTVRNLTIRNSGTSLTDMDAGIFVDRKARDVVIEGNDLEHILFGIYLDGARDVRVLDNRVRGIPQLRLVDRGDGIHLWNDSGVLVKGNDIGGTRDGIYIYISPHNRIVGNRIHGVRYGVHYMYSNHDTLEFNVSSGNTAGYALMQSDHLRIVGNRSSGDRDYEILLNYVTYSDFQGNVIRHVRGEPGFSGGIVPGGEGKGIFIYNAEYNRLHGNVIADCPIGVHITAGSDHDVFFDNSFIANRVQVKYVQNMTEEWSWHGPGNYWSDYLGWDLNGDGRGDVPYRPNNGVDVLLWKYPSASLLMSSPAILLLRYVQHAFPVFIPPGIQDSHPLMRPPAAPAAKPPGERYAERH